MKVSFLSYKRKSILTTNLDFKNKFLSNIFLKINTVISYSPRSVSWSTGVVGSPHLRWRNDWWVGGWYGCVCVFFGGCVRLSILVARRRKQRRKKNFRGKKRRNLGGIIGDGDVRLGNFFFIFQFYSLRKKN